MSEHKNAIIYCRVSSKEQTEGYSLNHQNEECHKFANRNGYKVQRTFVNDDGESAKSVNRRSLQEMLKYCSKYGHEIDSLIVWKFDRLSRNMSDYTNLITFFHKQGIKVISATEPADDSSAGKLLINIMGSFAQFGNDVKSERTIAGMKQAVKSGRWVWKPPVGYKLIQDSTGNRILTPDERACFVSEAFIMAEKGLYRQAEICKMLGKSGFQVSKQTLNRLLRNPVYAGLIVKREWFEEPIEGVHEPLVSKECFYTVQAILDGKKPKSVVRLRNNPDFPLRNFVICNECQIPITGSFSTGRKKRKYPYYHCRKGRCGFGSVSRDDLHEHFYGLLENISPSNGIIRLFREVVKDVWKTAHVEQAKKRKRLGIKFNQLKLKKQEAIDKLISKTLSDHDYRIYSDKLDNEIANVETETRDVQIDPTKVEECLVFCQDFLTHLPDHWIHADLDLKQRFQDLVFPRGLTYFGGSFGTAETSILFNILRQENTEKSNLATPTGVEPVLTP